MQCFKIILLMISIVVKCIGIALLKISIVEQCIAMDCIAYISIDVCVKHWDCKAVDKRSCWCSALGLHCL